MYIHTCIIVWSQGRNQITFPDDEVFEMGLERWRQDEELRAFQEEGPVVYTRWQASTSFLSPIHTRPLTYSWRCHWLSASVLWSPFILTWKPALLWLHLYKSSVQSLSHVQLFATPWTAARQASLSNTNSQSLLKLMPLSWWCHPTISSSAVSISSCLQSFPASGSFPMSQFFTLGGQRIGVSALASVLPMNIQDWSPLGWTGWISL